MAIQDTSKAILETTVHTRNDLGMLIAKSASKASGMLKPIPSSCTKL